jgi:peptide/nickel transport system substrate-binding protein
MSLAFDRETYVAKAVNGLAVPAVSTFVPGFWAHDAGLKPLPYDPNGAAALLALAGWRDKDGDGILDTPTGPASFTLTFSPKRQEHESLAALFQSAVRPLGIDVRLEALEWSKFGERIRGHAFEAALKAWGLPLDPDPYDFFHSSQYPSGQNFGGYASPEVDRLLEEGRRTLDTGSRAEIYHRLEGILREEQPYTFIVHPFALLGLNRRLQGVEIGLSGDFLPYPTVIDWWVTPSPARKEP